MLSGGRAVLIRYCGDSGVVTGVVGGKLQSAAGSCAGTWWAARKARSEAGLTGLVSRR